MAGSKKQFVYVTDLGDLFAIELDESNMEGVILSALSSDMTAADAAAIRYFVPSNVEPRYARYQSTTTVRTKKIILPRYADYLDAKERAGVRVAVSFEDAATGETFVLQNAFPEQSRPAVVEFDEGLNDGDAS